MRKKNLKWLGVLALCLTAAAAWGFAAHDLSNGAITISSGDGNGTITGTYRDGGTAVTIEDDYVGAVTLNGVDITESNTSGLAVPIAVGASSGASVDLALVGTNTLTTGSVGNPGLSIQGTGSKVVLSGNGSLSVTGGFDGDGGIQASGVLSINGGTVEATGGPGTMGGRAHGIYGPGLTLGIAGGIVKATGFANDFPDRTGGDGMQLSGGSLNIAGGTVDAIGSSSSGSGYGGNGIDAYHGPVTISGGVVTAMGGNSVSGTRGDAIYVDEASITITGGVVTATGGSGTGGGGKDLNSTGSGGSSIIITGGSVKSDPARVEPQPKNAGGDALNRSTLTGAAGGTVNLLVAGGTPYIYTAPFHPDNTAYVWLPTATFTAVYPTITAAAADDKTGSSVTLTGSGGTGYQWQKQSGTVFQNISGATGASYTDTGLTSGDTYSYRLLVSFTGSPYAAVSETVTATVTKEGGGGTSGAIADLLKTLNSGLAPNVSVAPLALSEAAKEALAKAGYTAPEAVTQVPSGTSPFTLRTVPAAALPAGYAVAPQRPSFAASLDLSGVTGNLLAFSLSMNTVGLDGLAGWAGLTDSVRAALLSDKKLMLTYEYADGTWRYLVPGIVESWAKALEAGVVEFNASGLAFNYAVLDGTGAPFVAGNLLAIPDGTKDGKLSDPVWLLTPKSVPTAIALTPTSLSLKKGASGTVKVTLMPAGATERDVLWSATDGTIVSVATTASADVFSVKGLASGTTMLTATVSADRNVKANLAVTVLSDTADLFESVTVSPLPPYRTGEEIEIRAKLTRVPTGVTASVKRPDGGTSTPTLGFEGTDAWATYTLAELGTYMITVTATDATGPYARMITLSVTEEGVDWDDGSSGGCDVGAGIFAAVLVLVPLGAAKRRRK